MERLILLGNRKEEAISVIREVAAWGREKGYRLWPEEWLTEEALVTAEAQPENFYIGLVGGEIACAFILQWSDAEFWPHAPRYEAGYLHKFCVRRSFAGRGMTQRVVEALKEECAGHGCRFIRLDTGLDEKTVGKLYQDAGFQVVAVLHHSNGRATALYELAL